MVFGGQVGEETLIRLGLSLAVVGAVAVVKVVDHLRLVEGEHHLLALGEVVAGERPPFGL